MTSIDLHNVGRQAPPTPSKYDIIPIHNSDRASFKFCRRQWNWSSPSRNNLVPKSAVHGVQKPLWFGTGIHHALERYYNPMLHEDPVSTWLAWFDVQWNGGLIKRSELTEYADRDPVALPNNTYKVLGLVDLLPFVDTQVDEFMELRDLGRGMMEFYKEYAEKNDTFTVIATEHDFSVPVMKSDGTPLYMPDQRGMPEGWEPKYEIENMYGPLMKHSNTGALVKQVHVRGRMDMIIQDQDSGRFGILDHKTTSRLGDDYFRHLELDEQCTSYLTYGEIEARMYDLEYKSLEFITYEAILKGYPKPPTQNANGLPSLNRASETTTAAMFEKFIDEIGARPIFNVDEKMQSYYTWLLEQGDKRFINRTDTWRNAVQKRNAALRCYYEAVDMLSNPRLYPSPRKEYGCLNCAFRQPCIAVESGLDFESMIEDGFVGNWDR